MAAGYLYLAVHTEWSWVKNVAYYQVLEAYGRAVSRQVRLHILLNPGVRKEALLSQETGQAAASYGNRPDIRILGWQDVLQRHDRSGTGMTVAVITPEAMVSDSRLAEAVLVQPVDILVECSRTDKWHTTAEGWQNLAQLTTHCLRVVVFDGGHHISTIGTCPDIILVPAVGGYAAHSYMKDGMKIDVLRRLLIDAGARSAVVAVPRWAVVKTPSCLGMLAYRAFNEVTGPARPCRTEEVDAAVLPGMSKLRGMVFCYWNGESDDEFWKKLKSLGLKDVKGIYIAFNYYRVDRISAGQYAEVLKKRTGKRVVVANEPVNVFDAALGFGDTLRQGVD